jgi:26S proteasome regulatory subunit N3
MAAEEADAAAAAPAPIVMADIHRNLSLIARGTETGVNRFTLRALRGTTPIRKRAAPALIAEAVKALVADDHPSKGQMLALLQVAQEQAQDGMDVDAAAGQEEVPPSPLPSFPKSPEAETYVSLLALQAILKCAAISHDDKLQLASGTLSRATSYNRRSLDVISSKIAFYYSLAYERAGRLPEARLSLLALHRTCCLRHDEFGQATVLNLLLRNLLDQNLLDQAHKLARYLSFCGSSFVAPERPR